MVATPASTRRQSRQVRAAPLLENSFHNHDLVTLAPGSPVPLLKGHVWLVVRGMTKLVTSSMNGDEALLGLVGPGEPFGEPLSQWIPMRRSP